MVVELRAHQKKAVNDLADGKVLVGGVGTGKTITALVYFFTKVLGGVIGDFGSIQHPMDLYVFTTARKRDSLDWQKDAISLGISTDRDASVGHVRLVVDSYNNIDKYKDVKDAFVILDEQRMVGSGSWSRTFIRLAKNNRWIMLSATPGDKWEDYIPLFVANGFYKNRSEFKRDHCVYSYYGKFPKLERYLGVGKLVRLRNQILVDMPYERHTTRHIYEVPVDYDVDLFNKVVKQRWHVYENRPLKDVSELFAVMRKVVNTDASRVSMVSKLLKSHPRVIVFYNFDYELELLRTLANTSNGMEIQTSTLIGQKDDVCGTKQPGSSQNLAKELLNNSNPSNPSMTSKPGFKNISRPSEKSKKTESEIFSLKTESRPEQIFIDGSKKTLKSTSSAGNSRWQNAHLQNGEPSENDLESLAWMMEMEESLQTQAMQKSRKPWQSTEGYEDTQSPMPSISMKSEKLPSLDGQRNNESITQNGLTLADDPWAYTIWAKDWQPRPGEKDPRESIRAIKAKYEFERFCRRHEPKTRTTNVTVPSDSESTLQIAEWNGHKHEPIPTSDRWVYLVQYVAGAEAWNCVETDTVVFYSLTYSYKNFEQAKGRIDRLDTPFLNLNYFVLISKSLIDRAVSKSLKSKKSFNERDLAFNG